MAIEIFLCYTIWVKNIGEFAQSREVIMKKTDEKYQAYIQILKEELVPAMGCTEPIALAYAGAKAREILGCVYRIKYW